MDLDVMNLSDDETSTVVDDDSCSTSTNEQIFRPNIDSIPFCDVTNGDVVQLTHVHDHKNVFVRAVKHDPDFVTLMKAMNSSKETNGLLEDTTFRKDDVFLVQYSGDFSRCAIATYNDDTDAFTVHLFDHGLEISPDRGDLRYISPNCIVNGRMAMPIKLQLPDNMSEEEISAVMGFLKKLQNNRFKIVSQHEVVPNSVVDLIGLADGKSVTHGCEKNISKRFKLDDIASKHVHNAQHVDLIVIENEYLSKGICCFVLSTDLQTFALRSTELTGYGESLIAANVYMPDYLEICFVLYPDADGTHVWYRAQFQGELANDQAQVGLIDFGVSVVVNSRNIRLFDARFGYERISFSGKIKSTDGISNELLSRPLFANFASVHAEWIRFLNTDCFEVGVSENYYFMEDDMIEV